MVRKACPLFAALFFLALPASATAQATRTWVSGVGDDANPCSRTAPCKTFAGAISKTAVGGEIDALDSGGFGAVTITKSITISATGVTAGVLVSGTNGIVVDAGDNDVVTLRGLDFNGLGSGLNGVDVVHAGTVRLENDEIYGFTQNGVAFTPSAPAASVVPSLYVDDSTIHDNSQDGVLAVAPSGTTIRAAVSNTSFEGNGCGLVASTLGTAAFSDASCGAGTSGSPSGAVALSSADTTITGSAGAGVLSAGNGATNYISSDLITGNGTGLAPVAGGSIVSVGANSVFANTSDGSPTSTQSTGPAGPSGPQGPQGPQGAAGQRGPAGDIELVTCKTVTVTVTKKIHGKRKKVKVLQQRCNGKLVSGTVKFTVTGQTVKGTLSRAGRVVARGTMVTNSARAEGLFVVAARVKPGRYTLTVSRGRKVLSRHTVIVG